MYTQGIRAILILDDIRYGKISNLFGMAEIIGHKAVLHNGDVYCRVSKGSWCKTPFTIDDFKVNN